MQVPDVGGLAPATWAMPCVPLAGINNGMLALPMTLIIITGGIDLSVGSVVALSGVVAGILQVNHGLAQWTDGAAWGGRMAARSRDLHPAGTGAARIALTATCLPEPACPNLPSPSKPSAST